MSNCLKSLQHDLSETFLEHATRVHLVVAVDGEEVAGQTQHWLHDVWGENP